MRLPRAALVAATIAFLSTTTADAGPFPTGFAVFGNGDININGNVSGGLVGSNHDVTLGSFDTIDGAAGGGSFLNSLGASTVNGPVTFNGNVTTGGVAYNGAVNATGDVNLGVGYRS